MLKVALCDDNRSMIEEYADLLNKIAQKNKIEIEISAFSSGEELLFNYIDAPEQADIIYLDILMDKTDGMETAKKLRERGCKAQIIFLTSCDDYVFEAFDVSAVQYLLKEETNIEKFESVFLKAVDLSSQKEEELFTFEFNGITNSIPLNQIFYFEIWKRLVTIHSSNDNCAKFYSSMEQLENRLAEKNFVRTHRSYLVNLPCIAKFGSNYLKLKNGERVPVGVTYAQHLKKQFSNYISKFNIYNY